MRIDTFRLCAMFVMIVSDECIEFARVIDSPVVAYLACQATVRHFAYQTQFIERMR